MPTSETGRKPPFVASPRMPSSSGAVRQGSPNTLCFAVPGLDAATALMALDLAGIALSSGSACSSGKVARSTVLAAMGVSPALTAGALRVSFGWNSAESDRSRFLTAFERLVGTLYQRRGQAA